MPSRPATTTHRRHAASAAPGRMRGWSLAVVAVAAAAGAVPLAVSTLAQQDAPLPRVGTIPVSAPGQLAGEGHGPGRPVASGPEHGIFDDHGPAATEETPAGHLSRDEPAPVVVAPLVRSRPTTTPRSAATLTRAPAAPRVAPPRPVTPRSAPAGPTRTSSSTSDEPSPRSGDDRPESGSGSGSGSGSSGGLLGGVTRTVGGVAGTVGSVLH